MNKNQTIIFSLLAVGYTLSTITGVYAFSWLVKLLPIALLIFITSKHLGNRANKIFIVGLVFSGMGDFFLAYDPTNWFVFGLGSFLIAHLFYMLSFFPIEKKQLHVAVSYIVFGVAIFSVIEPGLDKLFIPVLAYMVILLMMAIVTLLSKQSNFWLILGGISFAVSDSLLGVNKFSEPLTNANILIMGTYYLAQYSLVKGMLSTIQTKK